MDFLVGYTGFVGSNLASQHRFDGLFNSKNITHAYAGKPDLLVYAGVRAEMFLANKDPLADRVLIDDAIRNIEQIDPKRCVLVSSIAVYPDTHGANEDTEISSDDLSAYGANRLALEQWVGENIPGSLIIRLPAIYGKGLKKNFLYDYIHVIPAMLTGEKLNELSAKAPELSEYYIDQGTGFYKCTHLSADEEASLKRTFRDLGFSALNFTDSRSVYQFYALKDLWAHIEQALSFGLTRLNITSPPLSVSEVFRELSGKEFVNHLARPPYDYDLRSKYAVLFGGADGYIISREKETEDIREFVRSEGGECL